MLHLVGYIWIWLFLAFGLGILISYALWGVSPVTKPTASASPSPSKAIEGDEATQVVQEQRTLIESLRKELAAAQQERDAARELVVPLQLQLRDTLAALERTPKPEASTPAVTEGAPTATQDDLTLVVGIGPFIASKLQNVGITTYQQLAEITPEQQARLSRQVEHFQSRMTRESWVEQARVLQEQKYGGS